MKNLKIIIFAAIFLAILIIAPFEAFVAYTGAIVPIGLRMLIYFAVSLFWFLRAWNIWRD